MMITAAMLRVFLFNRTTSRRYTIRYKTVLEKINVCALNFNELMIFSRASVYDCPGRTQKFSASSVM